jgi:hypothetical protein
VAGPSLLFRGCFQPSSLSSDTVKGIITNQLGLIASPCFFAQGLKRDRPSTAQIATAQIEAFHLGHFERFFFLSVVKGIVGMQARE